MAGLERISFDKIDPKDPFFDSLRADYEEFDSWFAKKAKVAEPAYTVKTSSGKLSGFVYLKKEVGQLDDVDPPRKAAARLKVGTLKIDAHGTKLGERVIKKIFDHAIDANVTEIYVTVFPQHKALIKLLERYGFAVSGVKTSKNGEELVLVRDMGVFVGDIVKDYPFVHVKDRKFFLLAVYPDYHTQLFPDSILRNEKSDILEDVSYTNTIHKIYIAKLALTRMKPGDVVVIYRTTDREGQARFRSVVTSVCVVEEVRSKKEFPDEKSFVRFALPHSVFTRDELRDFFKEQRVYAVKMTYNAAFERRTIRGRLLDEVGIPEQPRWDLKPLTREQFDRIMELGEVNARLIVD
ncbi:N-acetyltransferase [Rhodopseudomonas palustris]|uniref:N-acetyltransferase n=1 Tax=Rhodopseudomonas palustris TaxID=1076 RepID=A0A418V2Z8_RHOPL|nr:N-acetyltransferase [Rhodopseudomonas palustris]RJF70455.1 N-acetyltransferase [Rhodopseudomonas palustris]